MHKNLRTKKLRIALDCDDVLLDTYASLQQFYKIQYPMHIINPDAHLKTWPAIGMERVKFIDFFEQWSNSPYYLRTMPLDGAIDAVRQLYQSGHTLYVVSHSFSYLLERRWGHLRNWFGDVFTDVILLDGNSKRDTIKQIRSDVFVDDCIRNILDCHDVTSCIAMQNKINRQIFIQTPMPDGVFIARGWPDVMSVISNKNRCH